MKKILAIVVALLLAAAPALPVVEVALKSGFNDLSHFCYLFPREFGTLRRVR